MTETNILIHGFGGHIGETQYLSDYLRTRGLATHDIALAGHGKARRELVATTHKDWIESARAEVARLLCEYERVNLIGFSMGGLISAHLAMEFGAQRVGKIVFINTPIYFWNPKIIARDIISRDREKIEYYKKSIRNTTGRPTMEFLRMLSRSKRMFSDALPPSLVLQCMDDESVRHKSAAYIKERIGECAMLKYYDGGCHTVLMQDGELREVVCKDVYGFVSI
ncbi:MAG: alpha/beta fold hydrolase [Defluviitaleaceae bacterium]|nr:alpha/beta fold hydrolase [Defluviitaleaceae bacterium]